MLTLNINMVKIKTVPMGRSLIFILLNPTKYNPENNDGWLLAKHIPTTNKNKLLGYSENNVPKERTYLEKTLNIAETKKDETGTYTKKGIKKTAFGKAIRLKQDKKTLLTLWKSSYEAENNQNTPIKETLYYFMTSDYFNNHKDAKKIMTEYLKKWLLKNEKSLFYGDAILTNMFVKLTHSILCMSLILANPKNFFLFLENKKEFIKQKELLKKTIPKTSEMINFLALLGTYKRGLNKENLNDFKIQYNDFKNDIIDEYLQKNHELKTKIQKLEIKLAKTKTYKTKLELTHKINEIKKEHDELNKDIALDYSNNKNLEVKRKLKTL